MRCFVVGTLSLFLRWLLVLNFYQKCTHVIISSVCVPFQIVFFDGSSVFFSSSLQWGFFLLSVMKLRYVVIHFQRFCYAGRTNEDRHAEKTHFTTDSITKYCGSINAETKQCF